MGQWPQISDGYIITAVAYLQHLLFSSALIKFIYVGAIKLIVSFLHRHLCTSGAGQWELFLLRESSQGFCSLLGQHKAEKDSQTHHHTHHSLSSMHDICSWLIHKSLFILALRIIKALPGHQVTKSIHSRIINHQSAYYNPEEGGRLIEQT